MVAEVKELHEQNAEITRMQQIFKAQQAAFRRHSYPSAAERIDHINRLKPVLLKYKDEIVEALDKDFGSRSADETLIAEVLTTLEGIKYNSKHVRKWMRPEKRSAGSVNFPGSAWVMYQPVGVVGVIVPWNYPTYLAFGPMLAALAAGNRVMIKMSEATPHAGALVKKMLGEIFSEDHVAVINGEVEVGAAFSRLPFNHILFTGSTAVGRHIMRAAAENLTPVTLELGGKSPAIIGADFPIQDAVERISFGKCLNAGQTCVSPDYIMVPKHRLDEFLNTFTAQVSSMYPTMLNNPDFTSVINDRQYQRLQGYLQDAREKGARIIEINPAQEDFSNSRKIPYTMVLDVDDSMKIAQEEIFGPLMIVVTYNSLDEAIDYVNAKPRPLALYYFDWNNARAQKVLRETYSGGVCINDTISHVGVDDIPFGGSGESGMGHYHGKEGFLTFSKPKGIFRRGKIYPAKNLLPPFGRNIHKILYKLMLR